MSSVICWPLCVWPSSSPSPWRRQTTFGTLLEEMINRDQLAVHPSAGNNYQMLQASSYDRNPTTLGAPAYFANGDNTKFLGREWVDGAWEYTMLEEAGAGALTCVDDDQSGCGRRPRLRRRQRDAGADGPIRQVLGANSDMGDELSFMTRSSYRCGINLYAPIPYSDSVKGTYRGPFDPPVYYNINYRRYASATTVQSFYATDPTTCRRGASRTNTALPTPTVTGHVDDRHTRVPLSRRERPGLRLERRGCHRPIPGPGVGT